MPDDRRDLDSLFLSALEIDSPEERAAFVSSSCGKDLTLRRKLEDMLASHELAGSFLEKPAVELDATQWLEASHDDGNASLDAGPATASDGDSTFVHGSPNQSVLHSLGRTLNHVPRVCLRESEADAVDLVTQPTSPEIPKTHFDSRYQLHGEIARGGMGAIIKGRDTDLGRDLAIKVLLDSHKDNPDVIQRFVEEAQIGGQLQHPGIAPIYELGQFNDHRPFFAMKLVKGQTLARILSEREDAADDRARLIGIFEQVCQTMAYAHSRGVIHRDLKPANIMVGAFGEVQVMDWGLAKVLQDGGVADEKRSQMQQGQSIIQTLRSGVGSDASAFGSVESAGSQTQMGSVMGTPAYMPPEQALGKVDQMDERTDVFGLGAILCEILTGQPPYVADDGVRVFRMASRGELGDAFERLEACGADAELITYTKQCLELDPIHRPRDAGVLTQLITTHLESVDAKLRKAELEKVEAQTRNRELNRRRKLQYVIASMMMVGFIASILTAKYFQAQKNEMRLSLYTSHMNMAQRASETAFLGPLTEYLDKYDPQLQPQEDLRGFEWFYWWRQSHGYRRSFDFTESAVGAVGISPHAKTVAAGGNPLQLPWRWSESSGDEMHGIKIWDANTGRPVATCEGHLRGVRSISYAPDGTHLASAGGDSMIRVWGVDDGELKKAFEHRNPVDPNETFINSVAFLPDGNRILSANNSIQIRDINTRTVHEFAEGEDAILQIAVSKKGATVAVLRGKPHQKADRTLELWDIPSEGIVAENPRRTTVKETHQVVAISDNGNLIATAGTDMTISLWDSSEEQIRRRDKPLTGHANVVCSVVLMNDGSQLASCSADGRIIFWDVEASQRLLTLNGYSQQVFGLAFSENEQTLASGAADGTVKLWDTAKMQSASTILNRYPQPGKVKLSCQDGQLLAAGHRDGNIVVWDPLLKTIVEEIEHESPVEDICFLNDAKHLAFGDNRGSLRIWDLQSDRQIADVAISHSRIRAIAMSAKRLAILTEDGMVTLLDEANFESTPTSIRGNPGTTSLEFSPDGKHLVTATTKSEFTVWNVASGEPLWTAHAEKGRDIKSVAYSPDGSLLAVATDAGVITLWDMDDHKVKHVMRGAPTWIRALAFSPGGKRLASGSDDHMITLWDLETGETTTRLKGHDNYVLSVAFAPDGNAIVSFGHDETIRLWQAATQAEVLRHHRLDAGVASSVTNQLADSREKRPRGEDIERSGQTRPSRRQAKQ